MAGPLFTELAVVTKWCPQEKTGMEPGLTARGPVVVTWPPSQIRRRMSSSRPYFLMLGGTGSGELMLPLRGRGSGLTEHPGASPTGAAANRTMRMVNTILSHTMGCGQMPLWGAGEDGSYVSIRWM